jgi:hypothetical protein
MLVNDIHMISSLKIGVSAVKNRCPMAINIYLSKSYCAISSLFTLEFSWMKLMGIINIGKLWLKENHGCLFVELMQA